MASWHYVSSSAEYFWRFIIIILPGTGLIEITTWLSIGIRILSSKNVPNITELLSKYNEACALITKFVQGNQN